MNADTVQQLLGNQIAQELLDSAIPARLSFVDRKGDPHVTPIWSLWRAEDGLLSICSRADSFKVRCIEHHPRIAVSIDEQTPPYRVLRMRGEAAVTRVPAADGIPPEYVACAHRYYGAETGERWLTAIRSGSDDWARVDLNPDWVEVIDFPTRFPWLHQSS